MSTPCIFLDEIEFLLTCNFKEGPLHFWGVRRNLAFIQALVSARYVNNFQPEVIGISEAQGDAFISAVSAFSNRQEMNRVVLVV